VFLTSLHFSPEAAGGDVRERIQQLISQVKAQPDSEIPLLQLAHLYAQIWLRTGQKDLIGNIVQCLKRASELENGQFVAQLRKLLVPITQRTHEQKLSSALADLEAIASDLDTRFPQESVGEEEPVSKVQQSPVQIKIVEEETLIESEIVGEDIQASITTAEEYPAPELDREPEITSEEIIEEQKRETIANLAENQTKLTRLFEQENLGEIIALYAQLDDRQTKCQIIDGLAKRIESWKVEPLLAVAALESDSDVYRYFNRTILKCDRELLCEQINLPNYSPDLQKVGVTLLAELGVPLALKKLDQALDIKDPIVRSVALRGIGRHGKRADPYIEKLVGIAATDRIEGVCQAAAKALHDMDNKDAYEALESRGRQEKLPMVVYTELDEMRKKYDHENGDEEKVVEGKQKIPDEAKKNMRNVIIFIVLIGAAAAVFLMR